MDYPEYMDVPGHPEYRAHRDGWIESSRRGKWRRLTGTADQDGYTRLDLARGGKSNKQYLHKLMCLAFHGPQPVGHEVCHRDDDKTNNSVGNLRWCTKSDNQMDRMLNAKHKWNGKLTGEQRELIRSQWAAGAKRVALAKEHGVTVATILYHVGRKHKKKPPPQGDDHVQG